MGLQFPVVVQVRVAHVEQAGAEDHELGHEDGDERAEVGDLPGENGAGALADGG